MCVTISDWQSEPAWPKAAGLWNRPSSFLTNPSLIILGTLKLKNKHDKRSVIRP